jgi:hypothetical protein
MFVIYHKNCSDGLALPTVKYLGQGQDEGSGSSLPNMRHAWDDLWGRVVIADLKQP